MKTLFLAVALVVACASFAFGQKPLGDRDRLAVLDWITYSSPEGHYSISVPGQPKLSSQEAASADGQKFSQYLATVVESDVAYMTAYFDKLPGSTFSIDAARDGMLKSGDGVLINETNIGLGAYSGRDVQMSAKGENGTQYLIHVRFYDVDQRVFMLQFIVPKSLDNESWKAKGLKYLDSFQLKKE